MGASTIAWTNATWTVTTGCRTYGKDCSSCYAETMSRRLAGMARADLKTDRNPGRKSYYLNVIGDNGRWNNRVTLATDALGDPLKWKKPRRIFVNSMSDLFYGNETDRKACENQGREFTPVPFEYIDKVFAVMALCPQHTFQVLTKRSDRMAEYMAGRSDGAHRWACVAHQLEKMTTTLDGRNPSNRYLDETNWPLSNAHLGTSAGYQQAANERLPFLKPLADARWITWASLEPLIEQVVIPDACYYDDESPASCWLDWIVIGAESGPRRRPMEEKWARNLISSCKGTHTKVFMKQMEVNGVVTEDVDAFPVDLRTREFPDNLSGVPFVAPEKR